MFFKKRFEVYPNYSGAMFRENVFQKILKPGVYKFFDRKKEIRVVQIPIFERFKTVINQEVLSKDNVALRFSYTFFYKVIDILKFLENIEWTQDHAYLLTKAEDYIYELSQVIIRQRISVVNSEEINDKRDELFQGLALQLNQEIKQTGIEITKVYLKDITFPKMIQDLFAKHLEAKIRAKSDLENARTQVAAARALKNASSMLKDNEDVKFLQYIETIKEISKKGKSTFIIGDIQGFQNLSK